ncbi:MAG: DsbA family protein [Pseudomonadota bacterium]
MARFAASISLSLALGLAAVFTDAMAQEQSSAPVSGLTDGQRIQLRAEIRAYILENPEIILEAIQILEERRNQAEINADQQLVARHQDTIFNDGFSYVGGNPDGDVTVVEFSDYRCGFCKRAHPEIKALLESDPNIRLIVKEYPILGPDSVVAGRMALAALQIDPDKFGELNDKLMAYPGNLTEAVAYRIAKDVGYELTELKQLAAEDEIARRLGANYALAEQLGLQGTPSFIIGDEIIRGYLPLREMQAAVAEARTASQAAAN